MLTISERFCGFGAMRPSLKAPASDDLLKQWRSLLALSDSSKSPRLAILDPPERQSITHPLANAAEFSYTISMESAPSRRTAKPACYAGRIVAGLIPVAVAALAVTLTGCAAKQLPFQAEGTRGQVGHHMTADIVLDESAAGCGGHAGGSALVNAKTLPPGIRQSGQNDWYFEGTPTQPGHWRTEVTLIDIECDGSHPDQILPVDFDIAP